MNKPTICTIIAKNYLAAARCLSDSFLKNHPDGQVFVLVIDDFEGYFDPSQERFITIGVDEIDVKDLEVMIYRYTVLEFSTAVKPFLLEYLFQNYECEKVCYFDPDIYFYQPIDEIWELLSSYSMVLTPHLLDFLDDEFNPGELEILQSGSYNLGFIGLSKNPELFRFLDWWQKKLSKHCIVDKTKGLFVDQKWIDLAPSLFSDVYIHRDPGCNVAYWNLNHRHIAYENGKYMVNGAALNFFHFSGFSPDRMNVLSKYQNRFVPKDLPTLRSLFEAYRDCLLTHNYASSKQWSYDHDYWNGSEVRVPDAARALWRAWESNISSQNPIDIIPDKSFVTNFFSWLNEPVDDKDHAQPVITRLAFAIYQQRPDLQQAFPDVLEKNRHQYVGWFRRWAKAELNLDDFFVDPMQQQHVSPSSVRLTSGVRNLGALLYVSFTSWLSQTGIGMWLEQKLGERFIKPVRNLFIQPDQGISPTPVSSLTIPNFGKAPFGLNLVGYLRDETGVGEVARACLRALNEEGFPVAYTLVTGHVARKNDNSVLHLPQGHPYRFNWFHINPDQLKIVHDELGSSFFKGKYNIGYWAWELNWFPEEWWDRFEYLDEIWVGSSFVQNTLAQVSPIPVLVLGAPVEKRPDPSLTRTELRLPEDKLLFLYVFDALSFIERKNPLGVVEAYRRAFGCQSTTTKLVIKVTNLDQFPQHKELLEKAIRSVSGILIDGYMDREYLDALFHNIDAYVSLHRSEGFGMTIAEAMCLGKPVIATAYSSTKDYMNMTNSYPVGYQLIELKEDYGPYKKGQLWADPDLDHAAAQMRQIAENPDQAALIGTQGAVDIQQTYSSQAIARKIIDRLKIISSGQFTTVV
jgi:glycosyltransferase involved in cell wall biosynthesis